MFEIPREICQGVGRLLIRVAVKGWKDILVEVCTIINIISPFHNKIYIEEWQDSRLQGLKSDAC
jgi:hypothetical protein